MLKADTQLELNMNPVEVEKQEWRKRERKKKARHLLTVASPLFLLALWEVLSLTAVIDPRLFPPPTVIIQSLVAMIGSGELLPDIGISLFRVFGGFLLGAVAGIIIGLLMGMYLPVRFFVSPLIMALMPIPTLALLPIFIFIFGIGEWAKIITIAGSVFFPVAINTMAGVVNIDQIHLDVARNYGAGSRDFFFKIALPGSLPVMLEGIQMGQAIALLTIVAAEMMGAHSGIGYLIWTKYKAFLLPQMYVGLVLISFFGYFFSLLVRWLKVKLTSWQ